MSDSPRGSRSVRETQHASSSLMMPADENSLGHVFGGAILALIDKTGAVCAIRHARHSCVTVSVDRVDFREPILVGELVHVLASVNWVGRTSIEVGVRIEAENMLTGVRRHTNSCYITYVALGRDGKPTEVPDLVRETPGEERRFEAGAERRRRRVEAEVAEKKAD